MLRAAGLMLGSALLSVSLAAQTAPPETTFYTVSYVEEMASARGTAVAALKQYRDTIRKDDGYVRFEMFEQAGRPAHFVVVETWRDQKAFDARPQGAQKQLADALQPVRVSDYDQRPYKTLNVGAWRAATAPSVVVISHVDTAPGQQPVDLLKRLADDSRRDEGNVRFDVTQHTMRANHFTVVEVWQNQKAFDAHVAAAHTKQYRDALAPMTGSPLDERVFRVVE